ncbi:MAG: alpha/beta hydrolase [Acidobacteriota bacterium]|nr:alpha/beta hydrolase [Acidobacteriota bacterium]
MQRALFTHPLTVAICYLAGAEARLCAAQQVFEPGSFEYSRSVNVAYDVQGTGEMPVVLLHSLGSAKESWDPLMPGLLSICKCRVYRVDLRGHGGTSAPDDHRYSLRENAAIVKAFMADRKLQGAILIGHSYGGAVALDVALDSKNEAPSLLRGLILIGAPGVLQTFPFMVAHHRYEGYGKVVDRLTTPKLRAWVAVHGQNYSNSAGSRSRVALYARLWSDPARSRASRETARQFLDGGGLEELASRNHDTGVPTLLIAGEHDRLVGVKRMRQLARSIDGSKLSIIPKAGHAPQEDVPESVIPVISDFLNTGFGVVGRAEQ